MKTLHSRLLVSLGLALVMIVAHIPSANAQEREVQRKWGLSAYLQTTQAEILVPIWLGQRFVLAPTLSANYIENTGTLLGYGAAARIYANMARLASYYGLKAQALTALPKGGTSNTAFLIAVFYGGEFFLSQRFSIGIEPAVNLLIPPNNGPLVISTSTMLTASVHF